MPKPPRKLREAPSDQPMSTPVTGITKSDDRIKVFLRVRPLLPSENGINYSLNGKTITVMAQTNSSAFWMDKSYSFREILDPSCTQEHVFETVVEPLLDDFMKGHDVLVFCYGSTNAGKTYTVCGSKENPGLLKRALDKVVSMCSEHKGAVLHASFIEIYNERIFDLLHIEKDTSLKIGIDKDGDTLVKNATELPITCMEDAAAAVQQGEAGRHKGFTELNCDSSRSHTIFRVKLTVKKKSCWLSIVDLAGCERLSSINSTVGSFKEACNINKSMLVLGKCIRMLKDRQHRKQPIPYRESKLTHLFKNFFEPVCRPSKAAMIINVSPSMVQFDDTIFALQFAAEASQSAIRQITKPEESLFRIEDEDSGDIEIATAKQNDDELEQKIRDKVRKEMEEWLVKREAQHKIEMEMRRAVNMSSFLALISRKPDDNSQYLREIEELENELKSLNDQNEQLAAGTRSITEEINKVQTQLSDECEKNMQTIATVTETSKMVEKLREQNHATREQIEAETEKNDEYPDDPVSVREIELELAYPVALKPPQKCSKPTGQLFHPLGHITIP